MNFQKKEEEEVIKANEKLYQNNDLHNHDSNKIEDVLTERALTTLNFCKL